ncbi:MAG: hypothetical protein KAU22_09610 [Desulfuromonadales bacterium]|nr:hypothetical protein [Desulfuromonadales bacterium]
MNDYFISMFIDDELDLDEKIEFVEAVHKDKEFKNQSVELLEQEKLLQVDVGISMAAMALPIKPRAKQNIFRVWWPPVAGFATACILLIGFFMQGTVPVENSKELRRFVIYQPDIDQARIVGNFTGWSPVAMEQIGDSGYWSVSIGLPEGEHRYSYLLEDGQQIADPTVLARERDDFGGENSIIKVSSAI